MSKAQDLKALATRLKNAGYIHGYEDAHPGNATTRQDKADTASRLLVSELHAAIDAQQSIIDEQRSEIERLTKDAERLKAQRDQAANELSRRGIWISFHQASSWATRECAMGLSDKTPSEELKGGV